MQTPLVMLVGWGAPEDTFLRAALVVRSHSRKSEIYSIKITIRSRILNIFKKKSDVHTINNSNDILLVCNLHVNFLILNKSRKSIFVEYLSRQYN